MTTIYILCQRYLDLQLKVYTIGGIQTYIKNLTKLMKNIGIMPIVIQYAEVDARTTIDGVLVVGANVIGCKHLQHKNKRLHECYEREAKKCPGRILYATEGLIQPKYIKGKRALALQHGVSWDKPKRNLVGLKYILNYWKEALIHCLKLKRLEYLDCLVCVDYNYVNWYRALVAYPKVKCHVIPNFTYIAPKYNKYDDIFDSNKIIKIIFARRFVEYRGIRIFAAAIKRLFDRFDNLDITLAGDGPDEEWLKEQLPESDKIHYIRYESGESLKVHEDKHIAVVPTTGSEGTSLSLLEAMSSQCAVVCTNVGGMTNIVIDHYNGLMISPTEEALYVAIKELLDDKTLMYKLADNGYDTVRNGFSYELWKQRWLIVLQEYM
jgi:glycosyltransferase involved in cell wall biosynthesis